jgi:hypothetical protein
MAGPVLPMGKNNDGSESRQAASSRHSVVTVRVVVAMGRLPCEVLHKMIQTL